MNLSLLLQLCPAGLVCLIWIVLKMGDRWPYSCCFGGCCFQDLFSIAHSILVQFLFSFFSIHLVSIHMVHPYNRIDMTGTWKKLRFILSDKSDFHMINNLSIVVYTFANCILMSFSVNDPTNGNAQKLKKAQNELINTYQKEQIEYIQGQINKIRNSEGRQSWIVWQTVNEVSIRKNTSSCQPRRTNIHAEKTFEESAWKMPQSYR